MKKPTSKQIARKTTWSPEDEVEFFAALERLRSNHSRVTMLMKRAQAISPDHPRVAISLLEKVQKDYPDRQAYLNREAVKRLAQLDARIGDVGAGADRLQVYADDMLARDSTAVHALGEYLDFIAANECAQHYPTFIAMLQRAKHVKFTPETRGTHNTPSSWSAFCGAAYFSHLLCDDAECARYLAKAKDWYISDRWGAPDTWRLWLFQQAKIGSRIVAPVLVSPEFTLAAMRDWAETNWKKFRPEMTYSKTKDRERLILAWEKFVVDLTLYDDLKTGTSALSFFRKKNLGKLDTDGVRELRWKDAGDYDAVDAINTSIELLDFFREDPRVAVDIGYRLFAEHRPSGAGGQIFQCHRSKF